MTSEWCRIVFRFICLVIVWCPITLTSQTISWQATNGPGSINSNVVHVINIAPNGFILAAVHQNQPPMHLFRSSDMGTTWTDSDSGLPSDVGTIAIATGDTVYASLSATLNSIGGFFRSTDQGMTWLMINTTSLPDVMVSMAISQSGAIYLGCASPVTALSGVYRSTDGGFTWSRTNLGDGVVESIVVDSSGNLFAGGSVSLGGRGVWRSTNDGDSWARVDSSNPIHAIVQVSREMLFASNENGPLLRSTDSGNTWIQVAGSTYINSFVVTSRGHIVGSSVFGVRVSADNGQTWSLQNSGLTATQVYSVALSPDGYLYCGTWEGGVFRSTQTTGVTPTSTLLPTEMVLEQNYPNPFNSSTVFVFSIPTEGHALLTVYDILGKEVGILWDAETQPGQYAVPWNADFVSTGPYFIRLRIGERTATKRILHLK